MLPSTSDEARLFVSSLTDHEWFPRWFSGESATVRPDWGRGGDERAAELEIDELVARPLT